MRSAIRRRIAEARWRSTQPEPPPPPPTLDGRILTVAELAAVLRVSERTVRRQFADVPGVLRIGKAIRIPQAVAERKLREATR